MSEAMIHAKRILAAGAFLALSACTLLPPSLRKGEIDKPLPEPAQTVAAEAAARDEAAKGGAPNVDTGMRLYPGSGRLVGTPTLKPDAGKAPEEASLNFEAADIREVAKVILADYLKESYTIHPAVTGTVTFRTVRPIAMKDLLPTLEMLLRQNNAAVVREEGLYKVLPITAVRGSVSPQLGSVNMPIPAGYSIVVIPLKYVGAREMVRLMTPFAAENTIVPDEVRSLLVIAGNQREMKHLIDTVEMFDVDWLAGYSVGLFPVKSIDVKTLAADFEKVFGQASAPLAGVVRVIPIFFVNTIVPAPLCTTFVRKVRAMFLTPFRKRLVVLPTFTA